MFLLTKKIELLIIDTYNLSIEEFNIIQDLNYPVVYLTFISAKPSFIPDELSISDNSLYILGYKSLFESICTKFSSSLTSTIIISKNPSFIEKIIREKGPGSILIQNENIKEKQYGFLPDFHLGSFNELSLVLNQNNVGYFTEVSLTLDSNGNSINKTGYAINTQLNIGEIAVNIIAGGRYFNTRDWRYILHQPSLRISNSKYNPENQYSLFYSCFGGLINYLRQFDSNILLTRVPPRKGKKDRFNKLVENLSEQLGITNVSNTIICENDYPNHKNLKNFERFENVKGQFKVVNSSVIEGQHIVILDDVITSGATIYETAKCYFEAGANKVTAISLALNQFSDLFNLEFNCSKCSGNMQSKINSSKNIIFFGCSNYSTEVNCKNNMSYEDGLNEVRYQIEYDDKSNLF